MKNFDKREVEEICSLISQGQVERAIYQNEEIVCELTQNMVCEFSKDEKKLAELKHGSTDDHIALNLYRFHEELCRRYESLDNQGNPIRKSEYYTFEKLYDELTIIREKASIDKAPQLWNDQEINYIVQAYYLRDELYKARYDIYYANSLRKFFLIGYDSNLYDHRGEYALQFLNLLNEAYYEYFFAKRNKKRAEECRIALPDLSGDHLSFRDTYLSHKRAPESVGCSSWLNFIMCDICNMDQRIEWLHNILTEEADQLLELGVSNENIQKLKLNCKNLSYIYQRLKTIMEQDSTVAEYIYSKEEKCWWNNGLSIFLDHLSVEEYVALSQVIYSEIQNSTELLFDEWVILIPAYRDKMISNDITQFVLFLITAEYTRHIFKDFYLYKEKQKSGYYDQFFSPPPVALRNECFDLYISYNLKTIQKEFAHDQTRIHPITDEECRQILCHRTREYLKDSNIYTGLTDDIRMVVQPIVVAYGNYLEQKVSPHPETSLTIPLPSLNKYTELNKWLEEEKKKGRDYLKEANNNRSQMCRDLTNILGWPVDNNALGKCINRNH